MAFLLYTIHVVTSFFLILVVLLQQGKGADLSVFGGGGTMTAFGARGAASLLHKLTVGAFVLFIFTTLTIGVFQGKGSSSVMDLPAGEGAAATNAAGEPASEEDAPAAPTGVLEEDEPRMAPEESTEGATPGATAGDEAGGAGSGESGDGEGSGSGGG